MPKYHLEYEGDAVYRDSFNKKLSLLYILPTEPIMYKYEGCTLYECKTLKTIIDKRQIIFDEYGVLCNVYDEFGNMVDVEEVKH